LFAYLYERAASVRRRLVVQYAGDIVSIAFPNAAMSGFSPR
jgi:hypothetical protein